MVVQTDPTTPKSHAGKDSLNAVVAMLHLKTYRDRLVVLWFWKPICLFGNGLAAVSCRPVGCRLHLHCWIVKGSSGILHTLKHYLQTPRKNAMQIPGLSHSTEKL